METLRFARPLKPAKTQKRPERRPQLKGVCQLMKYEAQDSNFLSWAKKVTSEHPDILRHMMKSNDVLDRVIAKRIMKIAGVEMNA
jgi:hypothetical protein